MRPREQLAHSYLNRTSMNVDNAHHLETRQTAICRVFYATLCYIMLRWNNVAQLKRTQNGILRTSGN